jgi:hypothetical protein
MSTLIGMAGSQVDQACAFCASTNVERLQRTGLRGDLTDCRCLTCNKTWAELLTEPAGVVDAAQAGLLAEPPLSPFQPHRS